MSDDKLLLVKDLTTTFATAGGDLTAVAHVSFDLDRNETLGIVGESGSGKTVLSRTIMGLQPRVNTTVTGSSVIMASKSSARVRRRSVQSGAPKWPWSSRTR